LFDNLHMIGNDLPMCDITVIIRKCSSGKSTLLHRIAGLTDPDYGRMTIDGKYVFENESRTEYWAEAKASVGMVFQSYTLWLHMDVLENLTVAPRKRLGPSAEDALARAKVALAEVGMGQHLRSRPSQVSAGERLRVAIARALMMKPKLLLCDEITGASTRRSRPRCSMSSSGSRTTMASQSRWSHTTSRSRLRRPTDLGFFHEGEIGVKPTPDRAFNQCDNPQLEEFVAAVRS
jgi:polar amino acid transport system ATP-binding protein